jgi:DNA-directed RNA polymerase specialized sigma24 family protein
MFDIQKIEMAQFDFRSRLKTWVYRIAVNHILDVKKSPVERMHLNFQRFAGDLVGVCHREARRIPSDRCSSRR